MELYCKKCNQKLTLTPLQHAYKEELNPNGQKDLLKSGMYIFTDEAEYMLENFDVLVAYDSINLVNHKDRSRFIGCCGPGDFNVYNQICPNCSAEIGVLIDDCWTDRFIGIDSSKVATKPLW